MSDPVWVVTCSKWTINKQLAVFLYIGTGHESHYKFIKTNSGQLGIPSLYLTLSNCCGQHSQPSQIILNAAFCVYSFQLHHTAHSAEKMPVWYADSWDTPHIVCCGENLSINTSYISSIYIIIWISNLIYIEHNALCSLCTLCAQVLCQQKGWDRGRWVGSPKGCCAHGSC